MSMLLSFNIDCGEFTKLFVSSITSSGIVALKDIFDTFQE